MENPKKMWENFVSEWQRGDATDTGALYYVVMFLREILEELRRRRPVELEPIVAEVVARRPDLRDTETVHGNRLDLVKHTAIEELNVAPQVAEYARRILMGARPEPDRGVMDTLWGYAGVEIPEGYTLVDRVGVSSTDLENHHHAQHLALCKSVALLKGVHPAAAELARRILAGEGPTVAVYQRVCEFTRRLFDPRTQVGQSCPDGLGMHETVLLDPHRTVLVVDPDVDLEPGDLEEEDPDV